MTTFLDWKEEILVTEADRARLVCNSSSSLDLRWLVIGAWVAFVVKIEKLVNAIGAGT